MDGSLGASWDTRSSGRTAISMAMLPPSQSCRNWSWQTSQRLCMPSCCRPSTTCCVRSPGLPGRLLRYLSYYAYSNVTFYHITTKPEQDMMENGRRSFKEQTQTRQHRLKKRRHEC
ncbi:uncharacterized protein LOC133342852 isoform X2 [Lethenteron reissneri]|uniref:uncharacterized protein LOC133342852 isoform X2 n=1 Tax=Lethenteron reissneri TaxID=7753 RepID=UPI002AB7B36B|nr:uncharacterized protein LOC133342852 isoform X2 [Lethenteron reissneri]